jgi:aspartyl-tRNA(Asn)/glutamyl-tRNA(Gln) amidotransferase subunit C
MTISAAQVEKVAALARLRFSPDKVDQVLSQFNDILEYIHTLNELDTGDVEPLYSPVTHATIFREDVERKEFDRQALLANAPASDGQFFVVPRIIG